METASRFIAPDDGHLDGAMRAAWDRDGFLALERFKSPAELAELRARIDDIVEEFDPDAVRTIFSTRQR